MRTKTSGFFALVSAVAFFALMPAQATAQPWVTAQVMGSPTISVLNGEKVDLCVFVSAPHYTPPLAGEELTYQWFKDNTAISAVLNNGISGDVYWTISAARAADAGRYTVVASNKYGAVTTDPITVAVRSTSFPVDPGPVDPTDREAVRQYFLTQYSIAEQVPVSYIGDPLAGAAGDISPDHRRATLHRMNWFRRMVGADLLLATAEDYNHAVQAGALIVAARGDRELTHYPTAGYPFYTEEGARACSTGALLLGSDSSGPRGVVSFIRDPGSSNTYVGHRKGMLFSSDDRDSIGLVPRTNVVSGRVDYYTYGMVVGSSGGSGSHPWEMGVDRDPRSVHCNAWPTPGFCPQTLIFGRWSFHGDSTLAYMDPWAKAWLDIAEGATVTVLRNGVLIPAQVVNWSGFTFTLDGSSEGVYDQYGQPVVTQDDVVYDVTISGVTGTVQNNVWFGPFDAQTGRGYTWQKTYPVTIKYRVVGINPTVATAPVTKVAPVPFIPRVATKPQWGQPVKVEALAFGATSYQWKRNGVAIPGATSGSHSFTLVRGVTDGEYSVTAYGPGGSTDGLLPTIVLPIDTVPTITKQPVGANVAVGQLVSFTAEAIGSDPITFQWYKGATQIAGATVATYTIPAVTTADAGNYSVKATNFMGTATSSIAPLSVSSAPTITTQPASQTIETGRAATFSVLASSANAMTYQWYKNGGVIVGATQATYRIAVVGASDAGKYLVAVRNSYGTTTSEAATLTVGIVTPAITGEPADQAVQVGGRVDFTVTATGTAPTYQWYMNGVSATGHTAASFGAFDTSAYHDGYTFYCVVSNASGTVTSRTAKLTVTQPTAPTITTQPADLIGEIGTQASFTVVASGVPTPTYQWLLNGQPVVGQTAASFVPFAIAGYHDGWIFSCVVTNASGSVTSRAARITVGSSVPPVIVNQPQPLGLVAGQTGSIAVAATGASGFQWFKNGVAVTGGTGSTLAFSSLVSTDAGIYDCAVTGTGGVTLSAPVVVGVVPVSGDRTAGAVTTRPEWQDIHNANGAVYDQFLFTGPAGTFSAAAGKIARCSYLDENGSIVQVEMSGSGAITIVLTNATGPMAPALYNQSGIQYMKGKATVILSGADATTHFTIYSVGTFTNPGVTRPDVNYAGWANVAAAGIISPTGGLGGIHQGNVGYNSSTGVTGLYAPTVTSVGGIVVVHSISASGSAQPYLFFGPGGTASVKIAGSALTQPNTDSITVRGLSKVTMGAGQDSCGRDAPALAIQAALVNEAGAVVTAALVVNP